jgi:hypothetical protein
MQSDPEASIRTNTCILIGRLGPTLGYNTKRKVLVPAFSRALKDVFVHARVAGLMALMATIDCFDVEELATKVIPNMSFSLVDKEKYGLFPVDLLRYSLVFCQARARPSIQSHGTLCQEIRSSCCFDGLYFTFTSSTDQLTIFPSPKPLSPKQARPWALPRQHKRPSLILPLVPQAHWQAGLYHRWVKRYLSPISSLALSDLLPPSLRQKIWRAP